MRTIYNSTRDDKKNIDNELKVLLRKWKLEKIFGDEFNKEGELNPIKA